jgi:prepilin-type N-terminal cleavage/methylation domain-containing protein
MGLRKHRGLRGGQGFTLIEVMVSLGVMTVGAVAILTLQQHTIRSNAHARHVTMATQIAERWVERFKQDARSWNQVADISDAPLGGSTLTGTQWLTQVSTQPNRFQRIVVTPGGRISNAFDFQGNDVINPGANNPYFYCASFRPAWVYFGRVMRVDVRVWWRRENVVRREGTSLTIMQEFPNCTDDNVRLNPGSPAFELYHVVYLPSVIKMVEPI